MGGSANHRGSRGGEKVFFKNICSYAGRKAWFMSLNQSKMTLCRSIYIYVQNIFSYEKLLKVDVGVYMFWDVVSNGKSMKRLIWLHMISGEHKTSKSKLNTLAIHCRCVILGPLLLSVPGLENENNLSYIALNNLYQQDKKRKISTKLSFKMNVCIRTNLKPYCVCWFYL